MRYLLGVMRHGSYSRAARMLRVSQPSLSVQIRSLEEQLGEKLLIRTPHGVRPTAAGLLVKSRAERIEREFHDLHEDLRLERFEDPTVRLGVQPLLAACFLPIRLGAWKKSGRKIRVEIIERANALLPELLNRREVDGVLMTRPQFAPPRLEMHNLAVSGYAVFSRQSSLVRRRKSWRLLELLEHPLVIFRDPAGIDQRLLDLGQKAGIRPKILFSSDQILSVIELAVRSMGLAVLPRLVSGMARARGLVSAPLRETGLSCQAVLVLPKDPSREPTSALLRQLCGVV